jgi:antitoxin (DNA-binding transcriptional repressor) of toxin-antitoxin stability system
MKAKRAACGANSRAIDEVGVTQFRESLAKYRKRAKAGHPVIALERSDERYVLQRIEALSLASVFCRMREQTQMNANGNAIVSVTEDWSARPLP